MIFPTLAELPAEVQVRIEVPRGSFVKRRPDGSLDFVSPLPCPYNYGSVLGTVAADGDPLDALVLGRRLRAGHRVDAQVRGVVHFVDAGQPDPKLVCSARALTPAQRRHVAMFFRAYAVFKRVVNRARRLSGPTRFEGWGPESAP